VVLGPLVVAVVGTVAALRKAPGRWRTVLLVGLALVVLGSGGLWVWSALPVSFENAVLEVSRGRPSDAEIFRDTWLPRGLELAALMALATAVWACLLGRPSKAQLDG
jgi:hypothetical protein